MVGPEPSATSCARCGNDLGARDAARGLTEQWPHFPFCSERCRMVDLGHWMTEEYRIPGAPVTPPDEPQAD